MSETPTHVVPISPFILIGKHFISTDTGTTQNVGVQVPPITRQFTAVISGAWGDQISCEVRPRLQKFGKLEVVFEAAITRIAELEAKGKQGSRNSSKPPSPDRGPQRKQPVEPNGWKSCGTGRTRPRRPRGTAKDLLRQRDSL